MADDKRPAGSSAGRGERALTPGEAAEFEQLLDFIKRDRGFDFTGYRRSSLMRLVSSRMAAVGLEGFGRYLEFLQVDSDEFTRLFDAVLVNVTSFFRDPQVWDYLAADVVPRLLAEKSPGQPIRVWSAGCASGQEAYSLAIMLAERLGPDELLERVKIYGTDVDEDALTVARQARYSAKAVAGIPDDLLTRYFEGSDSIYTFRKDLRGVMIFGRHDLVHAAPISHIDVLACRNTLMHFDAETQSRVLARLHFSLEEHGILFLGKTEMLLTHGHLFSPIDMRRRVFAKVTTHDVRDRLSVIAGVGTSGALEYPGNEDLQPATEVLESSNEELQAATQELETMNAKLQSSNEELQAINEELRRRASEIDELNELLESILTSERGGVAVIDRDLRVTAWHERAADLWGVRSEEAPGQHFLNLDLGLPAAELRPALRAVLAGDADHEEVLLPATNRRGRDFRCRVILAPLLGKGAVRGVILRMEEEDGD